MVCGEPERNFQRARGLRLAERECWQEEHNGAEHRQFPTSCAQHGSVAIAALTECNGIMADRLLRFQAAASLPLHTRTICETRGAHHRQEASTPLSNYPNLPPAVRSP